MLPIVIKDDCIIGPNMANKRLAGEQPANKNGGTMVVMTQKKEKALAGHSCLP